LADGVSAVLTDGHAGSVRKATGFARDVIIRVRHRVVVRKVTLSGLACPPRAHEKARCVMHWNGGRTPEGAAGRLLGRRILQLH